MPGTTQPPPRRQPKDGRLLRERNGRPVTTLLAGLVLLVLAAVTPAAVTHAGLAGGATAAAAAASMSPSAPPTPTWQRQSYKRIGYDKSFKADLIDELPSAVECVVFGGSRAMRFEPAHLWRLTGLNSFNAAVQCFRPEDAWAFSTYLFSRSPGVRPRCVIALQSRTFQDETLRAGLLYDPRLSRAFPEDLVARHKAKLGKPVAKQLLGTTRFTAHGYVVYNRYDVTRARRSFSYKTHLDLYITRQRANHRWKGPLADARARDYFEKTVRLYNDHGVTPLIVIMPYQPRVLTAFKKVGFQKHLDRLRGYLRDAGTRCRFRALDLTNVKSFGGDPKEFYDGVHVTRENARKILDFAVRTAPECFE
jgi:hypothetical protein